MNEEILKMTEEELNETGINENYIMEEEEAVEKYGEEVLNEPVHEWIIEEEQ